MFLKTEHMNYTQKVDYLFFHTQENMFSDNKMPSSCDYIVVNLCMWYQINAYCLETHG